jgi:hypothetical protein
MVVAGSILATSELRASLFKKYFQLPKMLGV